MHRVSRTTKLWADTLELIAIIAKATHMPKTRVVHEAVLREYQRLKRRGVIEKGSDDGTLHT